MPLEEVIKITELPKNNTKKHTSCGIKPTTFTYNQIIPKKMNTRKKNKMILNPRERYFNQQGIEKGMKKGIEKGMEKGMENGRIEVAKNLLKTGMPLEEVIKITELPKNKILENIKVVE